MFSECVPSDGTYTITAPAGFWSGLWHGMIIDINFILSLLSKGEYAIYEIHNNGGWYDFGFVMGATSLIGSIFGSKKRN